MDKKARVGRDRIFQDERRRLPLSGTDADIPKRWTVEVGIVYAKDASDPLPLHG